MRVKKNLTLLLLQPLTFTDPAGDIHPATCSLYVLEGKGKDIIIGTPSIFTDFGKLFSSMVGDAVERFGPATVAVDLNNLGYHDLVCPEDAAYPWTTDVMEEAPEDSTIPEASSYNSTVLQFLDQSYDDTVLKFHDWIDTGVDKEFLDSTNVRQLLLDYTDCFVFKEWTGMDIPEVDFTFSDDMPDRMKPHTRSIPQSLQAASKKEFERMTSYFFERCDSPWACPLVVAAKPTAPFVRLCINLQAVNKYIIYGHPQIPNVEHTILKLKGYKYFLDIDARNGYHQIRISKKTGDRLSVQTPWGQFRPKYLPEGTCNGTALFSEVVLEIFDSIDEDDDEKWMFVLHDNFLIGAHTHEDAYAKLEKFLARAREKNVYLKMEKTHLGQTKQHFFGYDIEENQYAMSPDRAKALEGIPFPTGTPSQKATAIRSLLGQTRIMQKHVPDYNSYSTKLDRMTATTFDWNEATWTEDYRFIFDSFKEKLKLAMALFFPDFTLDWILRTDASDLGYGGVLYQVYIDADGKKVYQPLKFMSRKFSDPATRWDTFTQECFAIFACIKECEYLLRGKPFVIETDHNNLLWLEASQVPKIIRQHLYIRTFTTWIRHVPGKMNTADY